MIRCFYIAFLFSFFLVQSPWLTNMDDARGSALAAHKHILLNFSGSDWCGPCIVWRRGVLDDPAFLSFADSTLVLVNADFPRMKKNRLLKSQQAANDRLADRYNPKGQFPLTILLAADGKVLRQWEGNPGLKPADFVREIRSVVGTENGR